MVKAEVWNYFELVDDGTKKKTECKLCKVKLGYVGGNTSSMRNHLKHVHKKSKLNEKPANTQRQTTLNSFTKKSGLAMNPTRYSAITRSLALACAIYLRPVSMVAGRGFRNFCRQLNPDYKVPCRTTVAKHLTLLYQECKEDLIELMQGCDVSFTTDLWTSINTRSFIGLTAHFIKDWHLHTKMVATRPLDVKHTGVHIGEAILALKDEFQIERVSGVVTDNAANMVVATREINLKHFRCYSHTLQLAVEDGLKVPEINKALAHARKLVGHFSHSSSSVNALKDHQKMMGVSQPLNLIQDVATRWNSQYLMIQRLLHVRISVFAVLMNTEVTKTSDRALLDLPDTAWKTLEDILPILDPLAEATELLTKEDTPTLSQVQVILTHLLQTIQHSDDDSRTAAGLKTRISAGLKKRFGRNEDGCLLDSTLTTPAVIASFLDPRYKQLKFLNETQRSTVIQYVEELMRPPAPSSQAVKVKQEVEEDSNAKKLLFHCLIGDVEIDLTSLSNEFKDEIKAYIAEPVSIEDPLCWWKMNDNRYWCLGSDVSNNFLNVFNGFYFMAISDFRLLLILQRNTCVFLPQKCHPREHSLSQVSLSPS